MTGIFFGSVQAVVHLLEAIGVLVILGGFLSSTIVLLRDFRTLSSGEAYVLYRRRSVRGLILGLEFLVAADIIKTITVDYTVNSVLMLGLIILIRSFLVMALHLEVEGRLPWDRSGASPQSGASS